MSENKVQEGDRRPCRGCGAPIGFFRDAGGNLHPLDLMAPVYLIQGDLTGVQVAVRTEAYVSHFSTCPKRDEFSKGKKT